MVEYFAAKYNIDLRKTQDQPCLFVNKGEEVLYLPTSLCNEASLPKDFTKDARKMRELQDFKIQHPEDRFERISQFLNKL